jgi:plastocyanin
VRLPQLLGSLRDLVVLPFRRAIPNPPPGAALLYHDPAVQQPVVAVDTRRLALPALSRADLTLGDLLVWTGGRWQRVPVGADDEVLTADSTADLGVAWAPGGGGSSIPDFTAIDRRYMRWNAILGQAIMADAAGNTMTSNGTVSDQPVAEGAFSRRSLIAGNNWAGYRALPVATAPLTRDQWSPVYRGRFRTFTSLTGGFMVGLWELGSQPQDNPAGSAAGSGAHACLRYYSGTDTYWSAASSDGTSTEVTATAVAPATDTAYTVEIQIDAGGTVRFYLNGSLIATHTTHVPASTDPLGVVMQVRRFSGASTTAEIGCHSMSLVTL